MKGRSGGNGAKTAKELKAAGTFRADRHKGLADLEPPTGTPTPPGTLTASELEEWHRVVDRLLQNGNLAVVDDLALETYARLRARASWVTRALAELQKPTLTKVTVDGAGQEHVEEKIHPLLPEARQLDMAMRQWLVEFRLTPASRVRGRAPEASETKARPSPAAPYLRALTGGKP